MKILVTGGAGFIGSAVCRYLIQQTDHSVVNLDKLTYAGTHEAVADVANSPRYAFVKADICDRALVADVLERHRPDAIMHLAAETHVDRSIDGPDAFLETNIVGTYALLQETRKYWQALPDKQREAFRFHHVSTDEVYGSLGASGAFTEETPYAPNSPYSASKASADHLVRAWHHTYGLPIVISNCSNNYGPFQFPEKLIPLMIAKALAGAPLPVYGTGENVRDWLYVDDHAEALVTILTQGAVAEKYNVGGNAETTNIEIVRMLCDLIDQRVTGSQHRPHSTLISFVPDRPGHDLRYAIDASKIRDELGWQPRETLESGLAKTVDWYLEHHSWLQNTSASGYRGERLGLGAAASSEGAGR